MSYQYRRPMVALMASALAFSAPLPSLAQNITLTSADKSFTAMGEFVSFENGIYMIRTSLGNMQVNASTVD